VIELLGDETGTILAEGIWVALRVSRTGEQMLRGFVDLVFRTASTASGLVAVVLVTASAVMLVVLMGIQMTGDELSPYLGIITYMVLPAGFVVGLLLFAHSRWRLRRAKLQGEIFRFELSNPDHRRRLLIVGTLTLINVVILAVSSYHGVHYMDSTGFCGEVCHQVMEPEFAAYQNSPHARVGCTDCHIGPGANWYVKSKLSGTRQVLAVALGTYPRPVPTPIENLRPARETCEQCHWPEKFHGDRMQVLSRFEDDEENTELKTVMLLKVGGGSIESGFAEGIHWHMNLRNKIEYRADEERSTIYWVRSDDANGKVREYWYEDADMDRDAILELPVRRMDCMDCHNRPTHAFDRPAEAVDELLQVDRLPRDLPYMKREAMKLLLTEHESKEEGLAAFEPSLLEFYEKEYPEIAAARHEAIRDAASKLREIYDRNVFPRLNVTWGTYPNHIDHWDDAGCFRCHDESHSTDEGTTISQDCSNCHVLLAYEEEDPEVLQVFLGEE
jgi:hypothetical protein